MTTAMTPAADAKHVDLRTVKEERTSRSTRIISLRDARRLCCWSGRYLPWPRRTPLWTAAMTLLWTVHRWSPGSQAESQRSFTKICSINSLVNSSLFFFVVFVVVVTNVICVLGHARGSLGQTVVHRYQGFLTTQCETGSTSAFMFHLAQCNFLILDQGAVHAAKIDQLYMGPFLNHPDGVNEEDGISVVHRASSALDGNLRSPLRCLFQRILHTSCGL